MPTYFGTIALFVFGILSSKEGATTCFIMLPMLIGSKGRIVVYGLMMRNFVEGKLKLILNNNNNLLKFEDKNLGPLWNVHQNIVEASESSVCIAELKYEFETDFAKALYKPIKGNPKNICNSKNV